jgi:hypothetical protein
MQQMAQRGLRPQAMEWNRGLRRLATWGVLLIAAGCSDPNAVVLAPVAGTVRYQGVPLAGAWVQFTQEDSPVVAGGFTDEMGQFELTSYKAGDGAPVGEHSVTITLKSRAADDSEELALKRGEAAEIADADERAKKLGEIADSRKQRIVKHVQETKNSSKLPAKYASPESSGLSFTVVAGTQNECEFDLTD